MANHTEGIRHHLKKDAAYKSAGWKRLIDRLIYVVGLAGPVMTIPQIIKIWVEGNATGVSVVSWSAFAIVALFWVLYGLAHKEKPIIVVSVAWFLVDCAVVAGVLLQG